MTYASRCITYTTFVHQILGLVFPMEIPHREARDMTGGKTLDASSSFAKTHILTRTVFRLGPYWRERPGETGMLACRSFFNSGASIFSLVWPFSLPTRLFSHITFSQVCGLTWCSSSLSLAVGYDRPLCALLAGEQPGGVSAPFT